MTVNAKPFSLQSPEEIAKTYDGNKQRIAQAVQQGVVDPTSGLLAGMFIDRIRSAAAQEQAPQRTVAQQVFTPRPPMQQGAPAGLASISPQAAPMAPPQRPAAPPPQQMPAMAGGGLADLPLPEDMFDEQSFSGGGIVAFAAGDAVGDADQQPQTYQIPGITIPNVADLSTDFAQMQALLGAPPAPEYLRTLKDKQAERKQQTIGLALLAMAEKMGKTTGPFLSAFGESAGAAQPIIQKSLEEDRAEERERDLANYQYELAKYNVKGKAAELALQQRKEELESRDRGIAQQVDYLRAGVAASKPTDFDQRVIAYFNDLKEKRDSGVAGLKGKTDIALKSMATEKASKEVSQVQQTTALGAAGIGAGSRQDIATLQNLTERTNKYNDLRAGIEKQYLLIPILPPDAEKTKQLVADRARRLRELDADYPDVVAARQQSGAGTGAGAGAVIPGWQQYFHK